MHQNFKEYVTASIVLKAGGNYLEYTIKLQNLFAEAKKVENTFVIEPVEEYNKVGPIKKASQILINYTNLGAHFEVAENAQFEKLNPGRTKTSKCG